MPGPDARARCSCILFLQYVLHPVCRLLQPITPRAAAYALQPAEHHLLGCRLARETAFASRASVPRSAQSMKPTPLAPCFLRFALHARTARTHARTHGRRKGTTCLGAGANACHLQRPKLCPFSHMHRLHPWLRACLLGGRPIFPVRSGIGRRDLSKKGLRQGAWEKKRSSCARAREKRKRAPFVTVRAHPRDNICRKRQASHATVLCLFPPKPPICALPCGSVPRRGRIPSHHHALSYPQSPSRFTTRM